MSTRQLLAEVVLPSGAPVLDLPAVRLRFALVLDADGRTLARVASVAGLARALRRLSLSGRPARVVAGDVASRLPGGMVAGDVLTS